MINILGYNLLEFEEYISETMIVLEKHRDYEMLDRIKWYFIELPKFRKQNPDMNEKINQWLSFIDDWNMEAVKMAESKNDTLRKARKEMEYLTGDAAIRRMAELREKWEMDYESGIDCAEKRGIEFEKKEIAKKLLEKGMKISEIMEITGLSEETIEKLTNQEK